MKERENQDRETPHTHTHTQALRDARGEKHRKREMDIQRMHPYTCTHREHL